MIRNSFVAALVGLVFVPIVAAGVTRPMSLTFDGQKYVHRWSQNGQHEFTPKEQANLSKWHEMVTIVVRDKVNNGAELAGWANGILFHYKQFGTILRTDSKLRTKERPAEHLIVAVLVGPDVVEATFARAMLINGTGVALVYSRRAYGKDAAKVIGEWLQMRGAAKEAALMMWTGVPPFSALRALPQE